jgi:MbtH protein
MLSPFDDEDALFLALINDDGQYSLWPASMDVPAGWVKVYGEKSRSECLQFIERNWADPRPGNLAAALKSEDPARPGSRPLAPGQEET